MIKGLVNTVNTTNKLFHCGCKTDFTSILDEISGLTYCVIVTKLKRDVCKNIQLQQPERKCFTFWWCHIRTNAHFLFASISVFKMEMIPHQLNILFVSVCVLAGWVKVRTKICICRLCPSANQVPWCRSSSGQPNHDGWQTKAFTQHPLGQTTCLDSLSSHYLKQINNLRCGWMTER